MCTGNLQKVGSRLCENEMKKLRSRTAGKQNATYSPYFTQSGVHLLEIPITMLPNLFSPGGGHEGRDVGDAGDGVGTPEPLKQDAPRHQRQLEGVIVPI